MTMQNIVNLTPHTINFVFEEENRILKITPSGQVARVSSTQQDAGNIGGIFKVSRTTFGEVVDLPEPNGRDFFIVSALVRTAVANRTDVASPGDLVRDAEGNVIGCKNFIVN